MRDTCSGEIVAEMNVAAGASPPPLRLHEELRACCVDDAVVATRVKSLVSVLGLLAEVAPGTHGTAHGRARP